MVAQRRDGGPLTKRRLMPAATACLGVVVVTILFFALRQRVKAGNTRRSHQRRFTAMKFACTLSRLTNGNWLARSTGPSLGQVEVTAPTREEALRKLRNELR